MDKQIEINMFIQISANTIKRSNIRLIGISANTYEGTLVPEEVFDVIPYAGCGRSPTTKEGISNKANNYDFINYDNYLTY